MAVCEETAETVRQTFPSHLRPDLDAVLGCLPASRDSYEQLEGVVIIEGEQIRLLSRFYSPEPLDADIAGLTERQRLILACLYSWHWDGHIRERRMSDLRGDEPWLPLFMLRLVGDYIEPIWERAFVTIDAVPPARYVAFAKENPQFMSATRDRILSYHRYVGRFRRDILDNPAYRFMAELGLWHGPQGRRWIRHATRLREFEAR